MNKHSVMRALRRLQGGAEHYEDEYNTDSKPATDDARLVRRFIDAERQEILILRRWVLLAASRLEEAFLGSDTSDGLITELRAAATPKREKAK